MKSNLNAFSLIEVVIALGIFAFCIVGIVGLLPIAANAVKSVSQESNANNIAESISGIWQVAPQTNISIINSSFPVTNLYIGSSNLSTNYFNEFGQQTDSNSATLRMEYEASQLAAPNTNSYSVNMTFCWPANAPTNSPTLNKRTFNYIFTK
jgi:uncharacterized protein (TIGR02598 family)